MQNQVVELKSNNRFKGSKVKTDVPYGKMKENGHFNNDGSDYMSNEIELLKQQIQVLEQRFDEKLEYRDKLMDAKFENISLKMDNVQNSILGEIKNLNSEMKLKINDSISEYKKDVEIKQKETKNFILTATGVIAGVATLIVTIGIPIIQSFLK